MNVLWFIGSGSYLHVILKTELGLPEIFPDLRFFFASRPSDGNIAELATGLKDLINNGIIPAKRVIWLDFYLPIQEYYSGCGFKMA